MTPGNGRTAGGPFAAGSVRLGIAPIGWTNDDLPELGGEIPFEQCIREMAEAGFAGTEVGSKFPRDPAALKAALAAHGLQAAARWFSAFLTTAPLMRTVEAFRRQAAFLARLGAGVAVVCEQGGSIQAEMGTPVFAGKPKLAEAGWRRLTAGLEALGREAARRGLRLAYHPHMGTVVQTAEEIGRLLASTDPERVGLLYDTGHLRFAGEDPLEALKRFGPRVVHVHLKDVRRGILARVVEERLSFLQAVKEGVFTVPGDGCIDFAPIFAELGRLAYSGWLIVEAEQDPARAPPLEYARKARAYLREKLGM